MSKVAIVTDSNSGITQQQAEELGISVLPMPFMIEGTTYFEGINPVSYTHLDVYKRQVCGYRCYGMLRYCRHGNHCEGRSEAFKKR